MLERKFNRERRGTARARGKYDMVELAQFNVGGER